MDSGRRGDGGGGEGAWLPEEIAATQPPPEDRPAPPAPATAPDSAVAEESVPAPAVPVAATDDEESADVEKLHQRMTGVEERVMESLEVETAAQAETVKRTAIRQEALEQRVEDLIRLQEQIGRQQSALATTAESLLGRIEDIERALDELARAPAPDAARQASSYQEAQRPPAPDGEPINLNAADFDQLRGLGLSVTQAARLIARRDAVNGFTSEEEVTALPGFPKGQLKELLERTRL